MILLGNVGMFSIDAVVKQEVIFDDQPLLNNNSNLDNFLCDKETTPNTDTDTNKNSNSTM